jgi:Protein of unknown function (DUF2934)
MSSKKQEPVLNGKPAANHAAEAIRAPEAPVVLDLSEIAEVAHTLWLESGCVHGRDLENWYAAVEIVRARCPR